MKPLPRAFYSRETVAVAKALLGKRLVREVRGLRLVGRIVEAEAYRGIDDPASHAARGLTARNRVMFEEPGHAYVYFTYGMHFCFNVVAHKPGIAGAVLIRALEPLEGFRIMARRRGQTNPREFANGPAKLTQAFAIGRSLNGNDLTTHSELYLTEGSMRRAEYPAQSKRIGVGSTGSKMLWRFYLEPSPFVSSFRT